MEQKSDLRVTKTRRPIKAAFLELVQTKPGQKITVTELAKRAEISKGTFYLHYLDIYNLYNQMVEETVAKIAGSFDPYPDLFSAPESFVRTFLFSQVEPLPAPDILSISSTPSRSISIRWEYWPAVKKTTSRSASCSPACYRSSSNTAL